MSYKKFVKKIDVKPHLGVVNNSSEDSNIYSKWRNYLPLIYQGPSNRLERMSVYDGMESDTIINWSLDTIADFVSQTNDDSPFRIKYKSTNEIPQTSTNVLEDCLNEWVELNNWKKRAYSTVRESIKYGDAVFIRDPQTNVLNKCNIYDILGVVADTETKKPTHYIIRNIDLNVPLQVANDAKNDIASMDKLNTFNTNLSASTTTNMTTNGLAADTSNDNVLAVDAKNVVHLSMNIDNILLYPFGLSVLESIYKTYIQKMLLQDCVLMYRLKSAPEKLVFSIPVGNIPRWKRKAFMEKCRNELSQRRMPSKNSDSVFNTTDVAYSSLPLMEDFWIPVDSDSNIQPKIEKLQSQNANLGVITDLTYWDNLEIRGLKVPSGWIPFGPNDGERSMPTNLANVYVQELRFLKYCKRIQEILIGPLNNEFKRYVKKKGLIIDPTAYDLEFFEPSNITEITEREMEAKKLEVFNTAVGNRFISKRFAIKKYLGLTEQEFNENQKLLLEENQELLKGKDVKMPTEDKNAVPGLRAVEISEIPSDYLENLESELNTNEQSGGMGGLGGFDSGMEGGDLGGLGSELPSTPQGDMASLSGVGTSSTPSTGNNM